MPLISVGSVIDRAWHHYTHHFLELMSISAWLIVLAILNIISIWLSPDTLLFKTPSVGINPLQVIGLILYVITFFVLAPILSIWISNRLIKGIDQQLAGTSMNAKQLSAFGWKYFFSRLLVGALTGLVILIPFVLMLPGAGLAALAALTQSTALTLAGTALLFFGVLLAGLGCIYVTIRVVFAPYALLLHNHHGRSALKASASVSKGRWWAAFWRVVIPSVVFYVGMVTIQIFVLYILKTVILAVAGLNAPLASELYNIGSSTVFILLSALIAPLLVTANVLAYRSLSEGR